MTCQAARLLRRHASGMLSSERLTYHVSLRGSNRVQHLKRADKLGVSALEQCLGIEQGRIGRREWYDIGREADELIGLDALATHNLTVRRKPLRCADSHLRAIIEVERPQHGRG